MGKFSLRKKEYKLSEEVGHDQVMTLIEYYDIDIDSLDNDQLEDSLESMFNRLVDHVRTGHVSIEPDDDKLKITQFLSNDETINYKEITARSKICMDKYKDNERYKRIYAFLGNLSGLGEPGISKLKGKDLSVAEILGSVLSNA